MTSSPEPTAVTVRPTALLGDQRAFEEWVRPHWPSMHRLARRMCRVDESEDVVQDALAAAWRNRHRFDAERGTARVWLLTIVANQARQRHRSRRLTLPWTADLETSARADDTDARSDLESAMRALTGRQRLAVDLYYFLDLGVEEVAGVMGCTPGTVKSTLSDARARLRNHLGEEYR